MRRRLLLICGILSPLLYVGIDLLAGTLYPGYDFVSQAISELFAIGAPTSGLVVPLFTLYDIMVLAFAWGVWSSAGGNRALRATALIIVVSAVNGLILWNVYPMHMRGAEATFTDLMHIGLAGVGALLALLALWFGASAFGRRFRLYTIATMLVLVIPGSAVFLFVPQMALGEPTPWVGATERISTYAYMQWQMVLTLILLRVREPAQVTEAVTGSRELAQADQPLRLYPSPPSREPHG
jgi:hypothetical protein